MSLIAIVQPDFTFSDDRGNLTQLVRRGFSQINVIETRCNVDRGEHYHKLNSEAFYIISGKVELIVHMNNITENYIFTNGDMFVIPPYVFHSFHYIEDTLMVSMYSLGVELDIDKGIKDIYTE